MSYVITGATGNLGGLVVEHLLKQGVPAAEMIVVARQVEKAASFKEKGIEVRSGDYNDKESLDQAFAGGSKLLFVPSPDAHDESLRLLQHATVAKAAKDAGIQHILYFGYAFAENVKIPLARTHLITEELIRTTGIPYTFLRNSLYAEVFISGASVGPAVQFGALAANTGSGKVNTASRSDLARAGAAALTGQGHENQIYNLTNNTPWTFEELAGIIAEESGKPVVYKPLTFDEQKAIYIQAGLPEGVALMLAGINQAVAEGDTAQTSEDLLRLVGTLTPLREQVKQALQA